MNHTTHDLTSRAHHRRCLILAVGMVMGIAALAGCGDDDQTAQEKYCEAGDELVSSITALADLDLIAEGTNGLESAIEAVRVDVKTLVDTATDAAADESDALEQAIGELESAIEGLAGSITADNVSSLVTAIQNVGSAAQAVYGTLSDCP